MKIIKQVGIIFSICALSVLIEQFLPFALPASVIGMILLFLLLLSGLLKIDHIREKSDFLLANMAFFFIPAGVNVINYLDILRGQLASPAADLCTDYHHYFCGHSLQRAFHHVSAFPQEGRLPCVNYGLPLTSALP